MGHTEGLLYRGRGVEGLCSNNPPGNLDGAGGLGHRRTEGCCQAPNVQADPNLGPGLVLDGLNPACLRGRAPLTVWRRIQKKTIWVYLYPSL